MSAYSQVSEAVYGLKHNAKRAAQKVPGAVVFPVEGGFKWGVPAEAAVDSGEALGEGDVVDQEPHGPCQSCGRPLASCDDCTGNGLEAEIAAQQAADAAALAAVAAAEPQCGECGAPALASTVDPAEPYLYCPEEGCAWTGEAAQYGPPSPALAPGLIDEGDGGDPTTGYGSYDHGREAEDVVLPAPFVMPEITAEELVRAAQDQAAVIEGDQPKVAWLLRSLAALVPAGGVLPPKPARAKPGPRGPRAAARDWTVKPVITSATNQGVQRLIDRIDAARGDLEALRQFDFKRSSTYYQMAGRFLDALIAQAEAGQAPGLQEAA